MSVDIVFICAGAGAGSRVRNDEPREIMLRILMRTSGARLLSPLPDSVSVALEFACLRRILVIIT